MFEFKIFVKKFNKCIYIQHLVDKNQVINLLNNKSLEINIYFHNENYQSTFTKNIYL